MSVTFDAQPAVNAYSQAFRALYKMPGFSLAVVLRAEAGSILKAWAGKVKVAKPADVDRRARHLALRTLGATQGGQVGDVTINTGERGPEGLVWIHTSGRRSGNRWGSTARGRPFSLVGRMSREGRFVSNWKHWTDPQWREIMETVMDAEIAINKAVKQGRASVGFSRQSVIQIADDLGIEMEKVKGGALSAQGIAKARGALARNGRAYRNGVGRQSGDEEKFFIDLINQLPFGSKLGMDRILANVLRNRAKFITTAVEKGALESARTVQRSFPEVFRIGTT